MGRMVIKGVGRNAMLRLIFDYLSVESCLVILVALAP